jgi:hypothetical protein
LFALSDDLPDMVVDWVMRQSTAGRRTGIQWTFTKQLEDQDFTDDISLFTHKQQGAQEKLCHVAEEAEKTGLQINIGKTEVLRVNSKQQRAATTLLQGTRFSLVSCLSGGLHFCIIAYLPSLLLTGTSKVNRK